MHDLKMIWEEATQDPLSVLRKMSNGENIMGNGVIMQKFINRDIELLNLNKGGDYYKELNPKEYDLFYKYGWKIGALKLTLYKCKFKLKLIESKIQTEVNTRKNDKHIQNLKKRREIVLKKYNITQKKLIKYIPFLLYYIVFIKGR